MSEPFLQECHVLLGPDYAGAPDYFFIIIFTFFPIHKSQLFHKQILIHLRQSDQNK